MHYLLVEKYRPKTFDEFVFCSPEQAAALKAYVSQRELPNLLFSGSPGTGKTTATKILIRALDVDESDLLEINASDENNVDTIREKIINFISTTPLGRFKVVHLGEADYISIQAQGILRGAIEDFSESARFILTCNYDNKIIPAIKSRCQHFHFKNPPREAVLERCLNVLLAEGIDFLPDDVERLVSAAYPDIRKTINLIQQHTIDGRLQLGALSDASTDDVKLKLLDLVARRQLREARQLVCSSVAGDQLEEIYRLLYQNVERLFKDPDRIDTALVLIAKYLYQHQLVSDPEINIAALFCELSKI